MKKSTYMFKNLLLTTLIIICSQIVYSQKNTKTQSMNTDVSILVRDVNQVKERFDSILVKNNWLTGTYKISDLNFNVSITFNDSSNYTELLRSIKSWGDLMDEKTSSYNNVSDTYTDYLANEGLKKERDQYEKLASKLDSTSVKYFEYWEKIIAIDKTISANELDYKLSPTDVKYYSIIVRFYEEEVIGSEYDESWINMPGIEFSYLITEQPLAGISSHYMTGYSLKYMFNYRKTYASLGLYKSATSQSPLEINEIYTFALGQDFYSRQLGRGKRKFFNLYTSFNLGVMMASSETTKYNSWFANPYLGLEIFKNKHILLDNKVGYFLPFENNRNQRGILYNVSFNFVF